MFDGHGRVLNWPATIDESVFCKCDWKRVRRRRRRRRRRRKRRRRRRRNWKVGEGKEKEVRTN